MKNERQKSNGRKLNNPRMEETELNAIFLENWMTLLASEAPHTRLADLRIPGSHDANSFSIPPHKFGSQFARCQTLGLAEQARLGARFFDMRYAPARGSLALVDAHGMFSGGPFLRGFQELKHFSDQHPDEFFVVNVQAEAPSSAKARERLIRKLVELLVGKLVNQADLASWFRFDALTLGQLLAQPKRFFVVAREELWTGTAFSEKMCAQAGLHAQAAYLVSQWHDVEREDALFPKVLEDLGRRPAATAAGKFFVSQMVLTFQRDPKSMLTNLFTLDFPTIGNFVDKLHRASKLPRFLTQHLSQPFNILMLDHLERDVSLLQLIVSSNLRLPFRLHKFFLGELDLTAAFQKKAAKNAGLLYLFDLGGLFQKYQPKFRQLCAIYSVGAGPLRVRLSRPGERSVFLFGNPALSAKEKDVGFRGQLVWARNHEFKSQVVARTFCEDQLRAKCVEKNLNQLIYVAEKTIYTCIYTPKKFSTVFAEKCLE